MSQSNVSRIMGGGLRPDRGQQRRATPNARLVREDSWQTMAGSYSQPAGSCPIAQRGSYWTGLLPGCTTNNEVMAFMYRYLRRATFERGCCENMVEHPKDTRRAPRVK